MLVRVFSVFIGTAMALFGVAMLLAGQGSGPCGRFCGLQQSVASVFGQSAHNLLFGVFWVAAGVLFAAVPWLRKRPVRSRNGRPQV